ncbi:MAG: fibrillarin-like rRNA/tRNA 2'-O-methyltransferase [Candidatus Aenigmarchaeota archaeon]|nr:fibrillarin-like rRNA/tRNA 2'-O-methyltransferase [Candidatus Aenigmarchaeota archaeon]
MKEIFPGVWKKGDKILTENLVLGSRVYGEELIREKKTEYRVWNPYRSKPAAAIARGLRNFPLKEGMKVLYLGIASGTTASHFSDIIGKNGAIYGVEISERSIRDLNHVAEKRGNIIPILANAKKPEDYSWVEPVDLVYQDAATDDQSEIIIRNAERFLKPKGFAIISIKTRSIDVTRPPREIYRQELAKLENHFQILEKIELDPYEKDHMLVVMRKK